MVGPHRQERRAHVHMERAEACARCVRESGAIGGVTGEGGGPRGTFGFGEIGVPHARDESERQFAHEEAVHPLEGKQREVHLLLLQVRVQRYCVDRACPLVVYRTRVCVVCAVSDGRTIYPSNEFLEFEDEPLDSRLVGCVVVLHRGDRVNAKGRWGK